MGKDNSLGLHVERTAYRRNVELPQKSKIQVFNLGNTSAFIARAKHPLSIDEYESIIAYSHHPGMVLFPSGEGTEISGFFTQKLHLDSLQELREKFDVSVGVASEEGPSFLEYDSANNFASIGCFATIAAARGLQQESQEGIVWQLPTYGSTSQDAIVGHKSTKIIPRSYEAVQEGVLPKDIPIEAHKIDAGESTDLVRHNFSNLQVVKVDINKFTNQLTSKTPSEQERFLTESCSFFHDLEEGLRRLSQQYSQDSYRSKILHGSRTADSLIFYFAEKELVPDVEMVIQQALTTTSISVKTVGQTLENVALYSFSDKHGNHRRNAWNGRIIYSDKPISEKEWGEKETAAVNSNFPQHRIYF